MVPLKVVFGIILFLTHVFSSKIRLLQAIPRSKWLSFGSGVSIAYILVFLMPHIHVWEIRFHRIVLSGFVKSHLYIITLAGLVIFYGLERLVKQGDDIEDPGKKEIVKRNIFWIHILSFAIYNFIIGYLLVHPAKQTKLMVMLFSFAMFCHFQVNDYGLYNHHKTRYIKEGKWIVALSVLGGIATGFATNVSQSLVFMMAAFIAGGNLLNTLKEELPEERKSNFAAFLGGTVFYTGIMLLLGIK